MAPGADATRPAWCPIPFSLLPKDPPANARPTLVFLGEKYPLQEQQDPAQLTEAVNRTLAGMCGPPFPAIA